jgi:hypothetical protein
MRIWTEGHSRRQARFERRAGATDIRHDRALPRIEFLSHLIEVVHAVEWRAVWDDFRNWLIRAA